MLYSETGILLVLFHLLLGGNFFHINIFIPSSVGRDLLMSWKFYIAIFYQLLCKTCLVDVILQSLHKSPEFIRQE